MAKRHDYIPYKDGEFDRFFKFMNQYVAQKCGGQTPEWTHIPAPARTALQDSYAAWYTAWAKTSGPHTPVDTEAKNDAKKAADRNIRPFVNQYLRFPPVTDEDRTAMGIPNRDPTRTEIQPPATVPELTPDTSARRRISVHYRDEGSARRGKPEHVVGIEIRWAILDHPPVSIEADLIHSSFDTSSPLDLDFDESDRGKHVYMAGRWEIHREGIKGLFGAIVDAIIP